MQPKKLSVLFLCTANSCRSQMAEGWARRLHGASVDAHSAGTAPGRVDPRAVRVMAEAGVDLSAHRAKSLGEVAGIRFDWIVTVCDRARESCPAAPGGTRLLHSGFDDPPHLVAGVRDEELVLAAYRRVRDEIRAFVATLPERLDRAN